MPLVFTKKYLKGYEFDRAKVAKAFDCKPLSPEAEQNLKIIRRSYRETYIGEAIGRLPEDPPSKGRIILVLTAGDDYEELKEGKLGDIDPWFEQAKASTLSGPDVYINADLISSFWY
jgi:hypothetical protein